MFVILVFCLAIGYLIAQNSQLKKVLKLFSADLVTNSHEIKEAHTDLFTVNTYLTYKFDDFNLHQHEAFKD